MTGVIYARYSSDNQREESIEGQLRECYAFARKNEISVVREYIDRAFSAKTDKRPDFQKMIKDSSKRNFDLVIVWKLDRFARNRYDSANYKAVLKRNGVKVMSATESISEGSEGILLESVLEGMAEYYSADLSEKVFRGHTENALKCKYNGGTLPIGYTTDKEQNYHIDPITAPFVLEAYQNYDEGMTMSEIAAILNQHEVKNTRGGRISIENVGSLLKNRRYTGEYIYRDIVVPDGIPAIIPKDLFVVAPLHESGLCKLLAICQERAMDLSDSIKVRFHLKTASDKNRVSQMPNTFDSPDYCYSAATPLFLP